MTETTTNNEIRAVNEMRPVEMHFDEHEAQRAIQDGDTMWNAMMAAQQIGTELKRCVKCGMLKPLSKFPASKRYADGHRNDCKECVNEYNRTYRIRKREAKAATTGSAAGDQVDKPLRLCTTSEIFAHLREAKTPARFYIEALKEMGYSGTLKVTREVTL